MNKPNITDEITSRLQKAVHLIEHDLPRMVGKAARDHYQDNFRLGGFVDGGLHQWQDVKRRDPASPWYGFEYKAEKRTSYKYKRDPATGKTRKADKQKPLNFSPTATARPVLLSKQMGLMRSIVSRPGKGAVSICSDKPYAVVHNEGGTIKVFGKHPVKLPKRQFIGESRELNEKITQLARQELDTIFKQ